MASILLGSMGAALGGAAGSSVGISMGRLMGATLGKFADSKLFSSSSHMQSSGMRLKDLSIQTSSYGNNIPIVFGVVRTAGNIIWARPLKEVPNQVAFSAGGKGGKSTHTRTDYAYFASFAIAISEGAIDEVLRIYAGHQQINTNQYNIRIYKGDEEQLPDPLIESFEGVGKTPAFRGIAYIVFEDLPLADFNNQLPNFNFEVRRKVHSATERNVEDLVKSIVMIPGGGEFVYDTIVQNKTVGVELKGGFVPKGKPCKINQSTEFGKANALVALDQLQKSLPNVSWISVVANWFGTSLNVKDCNIMPGVEFADSTTITSPDIWRVSHYTRATAHMISRTNDRPNYGGTINDASLVRYFEQIKLRGLRAVFYPMIFMDLPDKPWRGLISGEAKNVENFFLKDNGYNNFILHYANLLKGKVDAFIIGSEFRDLTKIKDEAGRYVAVELLCDLAIKVKNILGSEVVVTYAADWSEYHHDDQGYFHLDDLWACDAIDVVGIDAYFPLTNSRTSVYEISQLQAGWSSGEGYDYYYDDANKLSKQNLSKEYAWKNIRYWWENYHINPDGRTTKWLPKSKKIWFTEYGFPSVDCASNQPNVFFDPAAKSPNLPIHSSGNTDFKAQRTGIIATELFWENSDMVERLFLWCWDARPYPYWPDLQRVWSDGASWQKGHWVQGKVGFSTLCGVLEEICARTNLSANHSRFIDLDENIDGFVIDGQTSARNLVELLKQAYDFEVAETNGALCFTKAKSTKIRIPYDLLLSNDDAVLKITRAEESEMPERVDINYVDISSNYQISNQHAISTNNAAKGKVSLDLPLVMSKTNARMIAENFMHNVWSARMNYDFCLPPQYMNIVPGQIITIVDNNDREHEIKVTSVHLGKNLALKINAVSYSTPKLERPLFESSQVSDDFLITDGKVEAIILDLPLGKSAENDSITIWIGAKYSGENFEGATLFTSKNPDTAYVPAYYLKKEAVYGHVIDKVLPTSPHIFDAANQLTVVIENGVLENLTESEFAGEKNLALIGCELIRFRNAKQIDELTYVISGLDRGLYGTHSISADSEAPLAFTLIDSLVAVEIPKSEHNAEMYCKIVSTNQSIEKAEVVNFKLRGLSAQVLAPVHFKVHKLHDSAQISWIRRNRNFYEMTDYSDIPQEEINEKYIVELVYHNSTERIEVPSALLDLPLSKYENVRSFRIAQLDKFGVPGTFAEHGSE